MKHIKSANKKWKQYKGYSKKIYLTPKILHSPGNLIQEIKIKVGETALEHYHKKQTEIFYFINNNGFWIVNDRKFRPNKGDILVVEPFDRHAVMNDKKEDYLYIAFKINYEEKDIYWTSVE